MKYLAVSAALWLGVASAVVGAAGAADGNLIKDDGFQQADFAPLAKASTWLWYQIVGPSEAKLDKAARTVSLKGGKTFLHSAAFDVTPGKKINIGLKAQGTGKVSVECLWWTRYDDDGIGMAKPHRTIPLKPVEIKGAAQSLSAADTAPAEAKRAYIRVVVEDGTLVISEPTVTAAP